MKVIPPTGAVLAASQESDAEAMNIAGLGSCGEPSRRYGRGVKIVWGVVLTLCAACVGIAGLSVEDAPADGPVTISFTSGTHSFTVPAGITSIHVVAIGGHGGSGESIAGGQGGVATANVAVTPGEALNVIVGGNGANYALNGPTSGGSNGGGSGYFGGGGGGASDVRTGGPAELATRLVVAGGGGGGGIFVAGGGISTSGGDAGKDGGSSPYCGGGKAGTTEHGGEGGAAGGGGAAGQPGTLGLGGNSPENAGGGGGAGVFGGGRRWRRLQHRRRLRLLRRRRWLERLRSGDQRDLDRTRGIEPGLGHDHLQLGRPRHPPAAVARPAAARPAAPPPRAAARPGADPAAAGRRVAAGRGLRPTSRSPASSMASR